MDKLKICHYIYGINGGGVEKFIETYFSQPCFQNDEIYIITQSITDQNSLKKFKNLGIKIYCVPERKKHFFKNIYLTSAIIKKIRPDIVHAHLTDTNLFPLFCAKVCGVKTRISHSHNVFYKKGISKMVSWLYKLLGLILSTDYFACSLDAGTYLFGKNKINSAKFHVIKNALFIEDYYFSAADRKKIRSKYNISDNMWVVGNIGRLTKQKNQLFLVDVVQYLVEQKINLKLFIIGSGELELPIRQKIKEYHLQDYIILVGQVNNVGAYLSAMDVYVMPSIYEGLGIACVEAQISGLPVVVSDRIPKEAQVNNKFVSLSIKDDVAVWGEKIIHYFEINNKRDSRNCVNIVKKGYKIEEASETLHHLYQEAVVKHEK